MDDAGSAAGPGRAKGTSYAGNAIFVLLRSLDFPLQLYIIKHNTLPSTMSAGLFGLSPYYSCVTGMILVTSTRHAFWKLFLSEQLLPPSFAVFVSAFNTVMNGSNVLMSLWSFTSNAPIGTANLFSSPTRILGLSLFFLGSIIETTAELGRKDFKSDPTNKGKLYTGGLFGLARHINFGGYAMWRVGLAVFCGGLPWGAVMASYWAWYFSNMGIPAIDEYLERRYGQAWKEYEKRVPYQLFPGIY